MWAWGRVRMRTFCLQLGFSQRAQRKRSCSRSWRLSDLILALGEPSPKYNVFGAQNARRCPNHRADSGVPKIRAARANHGIVFFDGGRVFVTGRLCEGFACMLQLVTGVFVVMDFGVRGRRTDRGAKGLLGCTAVAWDVDCQLDRRLLRVRASFLSMFRTRGHGKTGWENSDTLGPARCKIDRNPPKGTSCWRTLDGERLHKRRNMLFKKCWVKFLPVFGCDTSRPIHGLERWARMV